MDAAKERWHRALKYRITDPMPCRNEAGKGNIGAKIGDISGDNGEVNRIATLRRCRCGGEEKQLSRDGQVVRVSLSLSLSSSVLLISICYRIIVSFPVRSILPVKSTPWHVLPSSPSSCSPFYSWPVRKRRKDEEECGKVVKYGDIWTVLVANERKKIF